ncbi:MAG: hypothetical protein V4760_09480 [Bdellovibrionota bacterium]
MNGPVQRTSLLKSETGFLEVEFLIAGALGLLLIGAVSASIAMMSRFQRSNDAASDTYYLFQQLSTVMKTKDLCTQALRNAIIPTTIAAGETPVSINMDLMGTGTLTTVAAGLEPIPGVKIDGLSLAYNSLVWSTDPAPAPIDIRLYGGGVLKQYTLNLRLRAEKWVAGESAGYVRPKDIPVSVLVDPVTNAIQYCEIDAAEARTCNETGGQWDPAAPVPAATVVNAPATFSRPRCRARDHCDFGGSFSDPAAAGAGGFVNPVTNNYTCPVGYNQKRTGTMALSSQSGKTSVQNTFYATYTCMRCANAIGDDPFYGPSVQANTALTSFITDNVQDFADLEADVNNTQSQIGAPVP